MSPKTAAEVIAAKKRRMREDPEYRAAHERAELERDVVRDRLAAALGGCAVREHYNDLLSFLRDDRLGESRIYFLHPINRIGNRISTGQGRAVIEALADDPVLGKEASAILAGRSRSQ